MKIVYVTSDIAKAAHFEEACISAGFVANHSDSGFYALTMLEHSKPDAIICASHVGDMTGLEFYDIVRSDSAYDKCLFILLDESAKEMFHSPLDLALSETSTPRVLINNLEYMHIQKQSTIAMPSRLLNAAKQDAKMTGTLEIVTLFDLVMSLNQNRNSGELLVDIEGCEARLIFQKGELIHASYEGQEGKDALINVFLGAELADNPSFQFVTLDAQHPSIKRTIETPVKELLFKVAVELDHLRASAV